MSPRAFIVQKPSPQYTPVLRQNNHPRLRRGEGTGRTVPYRRSWQWPRPRQTRRCRIDSAPIVSLAGVPNTCQVLVLRVSPLSSACPTTSSMNIPRMEEPAQLLAIGAAVAA
eukprot:scaffold2072_cov126-Isochrysis_galbana.AAC.16